MDSMATRSMIFRNGGRSTNLIVFRDLRMQLILEHQEWFQIEAEMHAFFYGQLCKLSNLHIYEY